MELQYFLIEMLGVDPYLSDLVFDYRNILQNSHQPLGNLQWQRCLARAKKTGDDSGSPIVRAGLYTSYYIISIS